MAPAARIGSRMNVSLARFMVRRLPRLAAVEGGRYARGHVLRAVRRKEEGARADGEVAGGRGGLREGEVVRSERVPGAAAGAGPACVRATGPGRLRYGQARRFAADRQGGSR